MDAVLKYKNKLDKNLSGTSLSGTSLSGTSLSGTSLSGTSLSGTSLSGTCPISSLKEALKEIRGACKFVRGPACSGTVFLYIYIISKLTLISISSTNLSTLSLDN